MAQAVRAAAAASSSSSNKAPASDHKKHSYVGGILTKIRREKFYELYETAEKLGTGSFATVKRLIRKADGKEFAVKVIKKNDLSERDLKGLHDEVAIMCQVEHPNVVKLYEMYETQKRLYLVMELLTGGELFDRIVAKGQFSEQDASIVVQRVASALDYLHKKGIVHRDLKPENLICQSSAHDSEVKLTDFGLAKRRNDIMKTRCGTPGYVAPEVLSGSPFDNSVDLWSLGVVTYILLCGFPPFYAEKDSELYEIIKKGVFDFPSPYWDNISSQAKDMVSRLICVNPKKRLTAQGVLNHPWIKMQSSTTPLGPAFNHQMRLLQARRKLRQGVTAVLAVNRFRDSLTKASAGGKNTSTTSATP